MTTLKEQPKTEFKSVALVEVWERPVRITHWLMAVLVVALGVTGYYIGHPVFSEPTEASSTYTVGTTRFVHILSGYALLATFLVRFYWGFVGNSFSLWRRMLPLRVQRWRGIAEEIGDLCYPRGTFRIYRGHTPLANLFYLVTYLGVAFSIFSGFTLHAHAHYSSVWRTLGSWALMLFGNNLNTVRLFHHLGLWFFAVLIIGHIYLVVYTTIVSRSTEVDTMISGRKLLFEEELSEYSDGVKALRRQDR